MTTNTTNTRPTTELEKDVLNYLNDLRESGVTNMFGAAPYISSQFPELDKHEARKYLSLWMENYNEEGNYETVKDK